MRTRRPGQPTPVTSLGILGRLSMVILGTCLIVVVGFCFPPLWLAVVLMPFVAVLPWRTAACPRCGGNVAWVSRPGRCGACKGPVAEDDDGYLWPV